MLLEGRSVEHTRWSRFRFRSFFRIGSGIAAALLLAACAGNAPPPATDPMSYRLAGSGDHWDVVDGDRVAEQLVPLYPDFFAVVLDPARSDEPDVLEIRDDLESRPVDRANFDALNAVAIGYFELNYRGESSRTGGGMEFLTAGFRAAKLAAVPWRAYGEVDDPKLRDAILDFFEDAGSGEKLGARTTAGRLVGIVDSLGRKEHDPARQQRIRDLSAKLAAIAAENESDPR